jgi:hypothetical protein
VVPSLARPWSHARGKTSAQVVPSSWQTTAGPAQSATTSSPAHERQPITTTANFVTRTHCRSTGAAGPRHAPLTTSMIPTARPTPGAPHRALRTALAPTRAPPPDQKPSPPRSPDPRPLSTAVGAWRTNPINPTGTHTPTRPVASEHSPVRLHPEQPKPRTATAATDHPAMTSPPAGHPGQDTPGHP